DGAISDYDRSIRLNPRYADAYCNRGVARRGKGDIKGAIADYDAAINIDPRRAPAYLNRGLARMLQGKLAEATLDFEECLKLDRTLEQVVEKHLDAIRRQLQSKR